MNPKTFRRAMTCGVMASCFLLPSSMLAVKAAPLGAEALLYSTMPSTTAHRPEMAMDGDTKTYFKSVYGMGDGDTFLIWLGQPVQLQSLRIVTGDNDNQDLLTQGFVEGSADGQTFTRVATFNPAGVAEATLANTTVSALRIRLNARTSLPSLLIREITLNPSTSISRVSLGPGRGFIDYSQAPDLAEWAKEADKKMSESWADTAAMLYTPGFITPNMVNVVIRTGPGVTDVAANGGGVMTVNSNWCRQHPEDTALTVHEVAHSIQSSIAYNPVWLIEGIADYVRWVKYEPQNFKPSINVQKATYKDSYRTTATFLGWCELNYDSGLVNKMNRATRFGTYKDSLWKQYTGKDVDTLWAEFIAAYQAAPANILTPKIPLADRPREVPIVAAGTSTSVSLVNVFNGTGISQDGATVTGEGFDGGGATYSSNFLPSTITSKNVQYTIGKANALNIVSSQGNTISLATGQYRSLWLLGAAVEGAQKEQELKVTYTDGTQETFYQNFSDWFQPQNYPGEGRAVRMAYRNMAGEKDPRTFYAYSYGFVLNPAKTVKSLTLPNNPYIKILAVTLAK